MSENEVKLLPCPFCGGEAFIVHRSGGWIYCVECGAESGYFNTLEKAIEAWNRRVNNDI